MTAKLVVLISGNGTNLQTLIDAIRMRALDAQITLVVSNRKAAYGLERAQKANIPTRYHPLKPYRDAGRDRTEYDADLAEIVRAAQPDWVVLAGLDAHFQRRLSKTFSLPGDQFAPSAAGSISWRQCHWRSFCRLSAR